MSDKYEICEYEDGFKRVLKNGKAINEFGLLKDVQKLQAENAELKSKLSEYKLDEDRIYEAEKLAKKENPMGCVDKAGVCGGYVEVKMYRNSMDYSAGTEWYTYSFEMLDELLKGE